MSSGNSPFSSGRALVAALFLTIAISAKADFVQNGSFSSTTDGTGQLGYNTDATGWTTNGYNFLFAPGTADTTGANGVDGIVKLWGPNDGSNNGLPVTSPDGGNFVAADGAYEVGAIQQTIDGLTPGSVYAVGFWWGAGQQSNRSGPTTEQWQVSLGSETLATPVYDNANHGFSGWMYETLDFTATSGSEVLSFLSVGTPSGVPPFALLDGVSMEDPVVPEPGTFVMLAGGLALITVAAIFRPKRGRRDRTQS
jgi:hypothetical protein